MITLQLHSTGADVARWQQFLIARGFAPGIADGIFGRQTALATMDFQRAHGLAADGVVGPATFAAACATDPALAEIAPAPVPDTVPPVGMMDERSEATIAQLDPHAQPLFRECGLLISAAIAPCSWKWTSGYRSDAEQRELWEAYLAGGPKAAPPGGSFHNTRFAADGTVFAADGHTPIYDGPQYDRAVEIVRSHPALHLHSGHVYGDDPHVMVWPPSLEDGRGENAVLHEIMRRRASGDPVWP